MQNKLNGFIIWKNLIATAKNQKEGVFLQFSKMFLVVVVLLWGQISKAELSILWWNVKGFSQKNSVTQTLNDIQNQYDVIVLGEARKSTVEGFYQNELKKEFPYFHQENYFNDQSISISILSRYPLKHLRTVALDWGTEEDKLEWVQKYKKTPYNPVRNVSLYEVNQDGKIYYLVPVHLLNPWPVMREVDGLFKTAAQVYMGEDHPLFYQAATLIFQIQEWQGIIRDSPTLLIGDFNAPSNPTRSSVVRLIEASFQNLMEDERMTFAGQALKIDHVFGNEFVQRVSDEVLFYEGSDHYPIQVVVE